MNIAEMPISGLGKAILIYLSFCTTGPDGYGPPGFPGIWGDKGTVGEPSPIEGSRGAPGPKGERGDLGQSVVQWFYTWHHQLAKYI